MALTSTFNAIFLNSTMAPHHHPSTLQFGILSMTPPSSMQHHQQQSTLMEQGLLSEEAINMSYRILHSSETLLPVSRNVTLFKLPPAAPGVPRRVYYGKVRSMNQASERRQPTAVTTSSTTSTSSTRGTSSTKGTSSTSGTSIGARQPTSRFDLYEFLKRLKAKPLELNPAAKRTIKVQGKGRVQKSPVINDSSSAILNRRLTPLDDSPNINGENSRLQHHQKKKLTTRNSNNINNNDKNSFNTSTTFGSNFNINSMKVNAINEAMETHDTAVYTQAKDPNMTSTEVGSGGLKEDEQEEAKWRHYTDLLLGLMRNPKESSELMSSSTGHNYSNFAAGGREGDQFNKYNAMLANWTNDLSSAMVRRRHAASRTVLLLASYTLLMLVSLFANLLVCHVVLRTRRLHTLTNTFLANLAASDLIMTTMNIPFSVARVLLDNWPFGPAMCCLVPFVQVASVYVSSFTMAAIAIDRYQVIMRPLRPRMGATQGTVIIAVIWATAALLALPYAVFNQVVEVFTYTRLVRCQARYPAPALQFRRWLTLVTFLTQYLLPLTLTLLAYTAVVRRVWWRAAVGVSTRQQATLRIRAKKKTVKMLLVVVVLFAVCWLPLNTYHLVVDFTAPVGPNRHSSTVFFVCHWLAMSSVCYNPFIYCWLNDNFRAGARAWVACAGRKISRVFGCMPRRGSRDDEDDGSVCNRGVFTVATNTLQTNTNMEATSSSSSAITCVPLSVGKKVVHSSMKYYSSRNNIRGSCSKDLSKASGSLKSFHKPDFFRANNNEILMDGKMDGEIHIPLEVLIGKKSSKEPLYKNRKSTTSFFKKHTKRKRSRNSSVSSTSTCSASSVMKVRHSSGPASHHSFSSQPVFTQTGTDCQVAITASNRRQNLNWKPNGIESAMQGSDVPCKYETRCLSDLVRYRSPFVQKNNVLQRYQTDGDDDRYLTSPKKNRIRKKSLSFNNKDCMQRCEVLGDSHTASKNKSDSKWHVCHFHCKSKTSKYFSSTNIGTLHSSLMCLDKNSVSPTPVKGSKTFTLNPIIDEVSMKPIHRSPIFKFRTLFKHENSSSSAATATGRRDSYIQQTKDPSTTETHETYFEVDTNSLDGEEPGRSNHQSSRYQGDLVFPSIHRLQRRNSEPSRTDTEQGRYHRHFRKYTTLSTATRRSNAFRIMQSLGSQESLRYLSVSAPLLDMR